MGCCNEAKSNVEMKNGTSDLLVEFLFLDEDVCQPCSGTARALEEAVQITSAPLVAMGLTLQISKIHIINQEKAITHKFLSSPTIRINGKDIDPARTEGECGSCGELAGGKTTVNCRNWDWRGEVYQNAPIGKIVEAILEAAVKATKTGIESGDSKVTDDHYVIPQNLEGFFQAREKNEKSCC